MISKKLLKKIKDNTFKQENLDLSNRSLTDGDVIKLGKALKTNTHIKRINLSTNNVGDMGIKDLLASLQKVEELDVSNNSLTISAVEVLAQSKLQKLNVSGNRIGSHIGLLAQNRTLKELRAEECEMTNDSARLLFANSSLEVLALSGNYLQKEAFELLPENATLRELILVQCQLTEDCAEPISKNKSLRKVDFATNDFGDRGAQLIASNSTFQEVNLSQNMIGNMAMQAFGDNTSIVKLSLFGNRLTSDGMLDLSRNKVLVWLDLSFNQLDSKCANFLILIGSLRNLSLISNQIRKDGAEILKQASKIKVSLAYNPVHEEPLKQPKPAPKRKAIVNLEEVVKSEIEANPPGLVKDQEHNFTKRSKTDCSSKAKNPLPSQQLAKLQDQFKRKDSIKTAIFVKEQEASPLLLLSNESRSSLHINKREKASTVVSYDREHLNEKIQKQKISSQF